MSSSLFRRSSGPSQQELPFQSNEASDREFGVGKPVQVVVTATSVATAQQAIRDGHDMGWTLVAFDMTLPRPVIAFERPRSSKEPEENNGL